MNECEQNKGTYQRRRRAAIHPPVNFGVRRCPRQNNFFNFCQWWEQHLPCTNQRCHWMKENNTTPLSSLLLFNKFTSQGVLQFQTVRPKTTILSKNHFRCKQWRITQTMSKLLLIDIALPENNVRKRNCPCTAGSLKQQRMGRAGHVITRNDSPSPSTETLVRTFYALHTLRALTLFWCVWGKGACQPARAVCTVRTDAVQ